MHLVFSATIDDDAEPAVTEQGGTTDAVAWVAVGDVLNGRLPVLEVAREALEASG